VVNNQKAVCPHTSHFSERRRKPIQRACSAAVLAADSRENTQHPVSFTVGSAELQERCDQYRISPCDQRPDVHETYRQGICRHSHICAFPSGCRVTGKAVLLFLSYTLRVLIAKIPGVIAALAADIRQTGTICRFTATGVYF